MASDYLNHLKELLVISEEMLEQAESANWSKVSDNEAKRRQLIQVKNNLPTDPAEQAEAQSLAESIYELNQKLVLLGHQKLSEYASEKKSINNGQRALAAYSN